MLAALEQAVSEAKVNAVLAGHVHAYERTTRVFNNRTVASGAIGGAAGHRPTYITTSNREGHYEDWLPGLDGAARPEWSVVRKSEFGHGKLTIANATHARWTWHRVLDGFKVVADEVWITRPATEYMHIR
jgi:hypothetical protein